MSIDKTQTGQRIMESAHTTLETLETYLNEKGQITLNDAIAMATRLLTILEYCHSKNMTHNNLSPSKVIVDNGQPALIDFSFPINGHKENGSRIKNFLELPEAQVNLNLGNRNHTVSDTTAVAGLLLFSLTGHVPGLLKDEDGRMPHQRTDVRSKIDHVAGYRSFLINQIFDKAFQWQQSERYQSAREFIVDLNRLKSYKPSALPLKNLEEIVSTIRSDTQSQTLTPIEMRLQTAFNAVRKICGEVATALEEDFREMSAGYKKELSRPVYSAYLKMNYRLDESAGLTLRFRIEIVGAELVVSAEARSDRNELQEELYRTDHYGFQDGSELEHSVREFVASNLAIFLTTISG